MMTTKNDLHDHVRSLIAEAKTKDAITFLKVKTKGFENELAIQEGRINELESQNRRGVMNSDIYIQEQNKVRAAILEIAEEAFASTEHKRLLFSSVQFDGLFFENKLEAYWAAFFKLIGWQWVYKPFDLKGWSPNFKIKTEAGTNFLVDVGSIEDFTAAKRLHLGQATDFSKNILSVNEYPFPERYVTNCIGSTASALGEFDKEDKDYEFHSSVVCNTYGQGNDIYNLGNHLESLGDIFDATPEFCLPIWRQAKNIVNGFQS